MTSEVDLRLCVHCHCLAARREARAITRLYEARLRRHGLRATQFTILAALALMGPTAMGELAGRLGLERTTLTRSAALLEERGWIAQEPARDRRERPIRLTPEGKAKLEAAYPDWRAVQETIDEMRRTGTPIEAAEAETEGAHARNGEGDDR